MNNIVRFIFNEKFWKSEICRSRTLITEPTRLIKEAKKSTIYDYCSWIVTVCLPKRMRNNIGKKKKKWRKCKCKTQQPNPNLHLMGDFNSCFENRISKEYRFQQWVWNKITQIKEGEKKKTGFLSLL